MTSSEHRLLKKALQSALLLGGLSSMPAMAHLYPINLGNFDGTVGASASAVSSVTGSYGWIDGTDADWSDTHKLAPFSFTLTSAADVKLTFQAAVAGGGRGGLNPGFSLYLGHPHDTSLGFADHDFSVGSELIRSTDCAATPGCTNTEGSFRALTSWRITTDSDPQAVNPSTFEYIGHAYDGSQDYGVGVISGWDGVLDNSVSKIFRLGPGTYTAFVGGSLYANQTSTSANALRGVSAGITVVPLPAPLALMASGIVFLRLAGRKSGRISASIF
ncbi:hypothetical protein HC024_04100 [Methylococcaceae bacterium WWC4]|nr:hypothetical protein [Methylococcaceae bacterium WWC4]